MLQALRDAEGLDAEFFEDEKRRTHKLRMISRNLVGAVIEWLREEPTLLLEAEIDGGWITVSYAHMGRELPGRRARKHGGGRPRLTELDQDQQRLARTARSARLKGEPWKDIEELCGGTTTRTLKKYIRLLDSGAIGRN